MRGQQTGFCHLNYISGPAAMSLVQCQKCALVYASLTPAPHAIVCVEIVQIALTPIMLVWLKIA